MPYSSEVAIDSDVDFAQASLSVSVGLGCTVLLLEPMAIICYPDEKVSLGWNFYY